MRLQAVILTRARFSPPRRACVPALRVSVTLSRKRESITGPRRWWMVVARERTAGDGKRRSVRARGLKAGAGLRGPYGTSVRHSWPTWILLVPAITLVSIRPLRSSFLPSRSSPSLKKLCTQTRSAMHACVPFSPSSSTSPFFSLHVALSFNLSEIFRVFHRRKCMPTDISTTPATRRVRIHDDATTFARSRGRHAPLPADRDEKCLPILLPSAVRSR